MGSEDGILESGESGSARRAGLRRVLLLGKWAVMGVLWGTSLLMAALILSLSWVPDSRMRLVRWIPEWLAAWADSGGRVENLRTGIPLVLAGLLFSLSWRMSGLRHWAVGGIGLALAVVLLAEAGQHFLPMRTADWGDVWWGAAGAIAGVVLSALFGLCAKGVALLASRHSTAESVSPISDPDESCE